MIEDVGTDGVRPSRWAIAGVAYLLLLILTLTLPPLAVHVADNHSNQAVARESAQRSLAMANSVHQSQVTGRIVTCQSFNDQQVLAIKFSDAHDYLTASLLAPEPRTPRMESLVAAALRAEHALTVRYHKFRDCSPAGIKRFYAKTP